jgi:hypothetical protein
MITLAEAWHWIQVGFCAALGGSFIFGSIAASMGRGSAPAPEQDYPEPHCSRCCPTLDDGD